MSVQLRVYLLHYSLNNWISARHIEQLVLPALNQTLQVCLNELWQPETALAFFIQL